MSVAFSNWWRVRIIHWSKQKKTYMLQPFDWIPTFDVQGHVTLGVLLSANTLQVSFVDSAGVIQPRASLGI